MFTGRESIGLLRCWGSHLEVAPMCGWQLGIGGLGTWATWDWGTLGTGGLVLGDLDLGDKLVVPDRKVVKALPSNRHGIRGHTRQHRLIYKQPDQTQPGDSQTYHMATWRAGRLGFVLAGDCGLGSDDQSRAQGYRRGRHNSHTSVGESC